MRARSSTGTGRAVVGGALLAATLLLGGPAAAQESPAPASGEAGADDPCATTNPDGTPREPDPMCQSGLPVDSGTGSPAGDELPYTGADDHRLLALTALGSGLVLAGVGAVVVGRRRTGDAGA